MITTEGNYYIKVPEDNTNSVELWSTKRLPFEPKGWLLEMRNSLRSAIESLRADDEGILHAIYHSDKPGYCDVENILLYNVGTGAFKHLCRHGLIFERGDKMPSDPPPPLVKKARHHHCYSSIKREEINSLWKKEKILAKWSKVTSPPVRADDKPHVFWHVMKKGKVQVSNGHSVPQVYGVNIKIEAPVGTIINLASAVKPLLDGVISAFHVHDGSDISFVTERLAEYLGIRSAIVADMLTDSRTSVLGKRNLVHKFGKGVQWNPADDNCMMCEILFDDCTTDSSWSLSGEMFNIKR